MQMNCIWLQKCILSLLELAFDVGDMQSKDKLAHLHYEDCFCKFLKACTNLVHVDSYGVKNQVKGKIVREVLTWIMFENPRFDSVSWSSL